jgi:hypothetical protein
LFIVKLKRNSELNVLFIFTFGSVMVPFCMTCAHENHLFLGSVLLCLCIPVMHLKRFTWSAVVLICIQQVNIFFHYQLGTNRFSVIDIQPYYNMHMDLVLSLISCVLFIDILFTMMKRLAFENNY